MRRGWGTALAAALTLGMATQAGAAVTPVTGTSSAFADSVGVNIHEFYPGTAYGDKARLKNLLVELGVKHVRDGIRFDREPYVNEYPNAREIAAAGIKFLWGVGDPAVGDYGHDQIDGDSDGAGDKDQWPELPPRVYRADEAIALLTDPNRLGGTAEAFEGPNEWDNPRHRHAWVADPQDPELDPNRDPLWATDLLSFHSSHFAAMKAHPEFSAMPFWGPSFMTKPGRKEYAELPGANQLMDRPNAHPYPGGRTPETTIEAELNAVATVFGDPNRKPVITETGYHNAIHNGNWGHFGVSERAQSIYIARALLVAFAAGVPRTYLYQFLDQEPETAMVDMEQHFGLVAIEGTGHHTTWTTRKKPAFNTVRELLEITRDTGTGTRPSSLDYSLTGAPSTLRRVLLARSDGSVDLVLWNAVPVYKESTWDCNDPRIPASITDPHQRCEYAKYNLAVDQGDLFPADVTVGLQLGAAKDVSTERPHSQTTFTPLGRGTSFSLAVGADPVFVRVRP